MINKISCSLKSDPIVGQFLTPKEQMLCPTEQMNRCSHLRSLFPTVLDFVFSLTFIQQTTDWMIILYLTTWLRAATNRVSLPPKLWSRRPLRWALSLRPRLPLLAKRILIEVNGPKRKMKSSRLWSTHMVSISGRRSLRISRTGRTFNASSDGTKWWIRGWWRDHGPNRSVFCFLSLISYPFMEVLVWLSIKLIAHDLPVLLFPVWEETLNYCFINQLKGGNTFQRLTIHICEEIFWSFCRDIHN